MEADLITRLRAHAGVAGAAGVVPIGAATRPAIDWAERKSDDEAAFPAAVLQVVAGAGEYDQAGPSGLTEARIRIWTYGRSQEAANALSKAIRTALEPAATSGATRFHRSKVVLIRDLPPEDLPDGRRIFTRAADFRVPSTPTGE